MEVLKQWAICIIFAAVAGAFVMIISPRGATDKTVRAVVGIFIVTAICTPLTMLQESDFVDLAFAWEEAPNDNSEALDEYILSVCKTAVNDTVNETAKEYGIMVEYIAIDAYIDEYNSIIIQNIQIEIQRHGLCSADDFSRKLEENLGAPVTVNAE